MLHQVVSYSCRGISDSPHPSPLRDLQNFLEDEEQKYDNIRNILHVVPYPKLNKWKSNFSRVLPSIRKHNTAPIAIILAPSNIAAKFQHKQNVPELGSDLHSDKHNIVEGQPHRKNIIHSMKIIHPNNDRHSSEVDDKHTEYAYSRENPVIDNSSDGNVDTRKNLNLSDVKSHEYTNFVFDKNTFEDYINRNNKDEISIHYNSLESNAHAPINFLENEEHTITNEADDSDDQRKTTDDILMNISEARDFYNEKETLKPKIKLPFILESNKFNEMFINSKLIKDSLKLKHNISVGKEDLEDNGVNIETINDPMSVDPMRRINDPKVFGEKPIELQELEREFKKNHFHNNCIKTDCKYSSQNGTNSSINFQFYFHR